MVDKVTVFPNDNEVNVYSGQNKYTVPFHKICSHENLPLPLFIDFTKLKQMLKDQNVAYHHIEPHLQINLPFGYNIITVIDRDGNRYLIQARLDANTWTILR